MRVLRVIDAMHCARFGPHDPALPDPRRSASAIYGRAKPKVTSGRTRIGTDWAIRWGAIIPPPAPDRRLRGCLAQADLLFHLSHHRSRNSSGFRRSTPQNLVNVAGIPLEFLKTF